MAETLVNRRIRWGLHLRRTVIITLIVTWPGLYYLYRCYACTNFGVVVEKRVYRSAEPSASDLKQWHRRYGLRSVIDLRGPLKFPEVAAEKRLAEELGMQYANVELSASYLPTPGMLTKIIHLLETFPQPLLFHCKGGADRSGLTGCLAAMAVGGVPYEEARRRHVSWRYFHVDRNPAKICGLLDLYERYCRETNTPTSGWKQFRQWAMNDYHRLYCRLTPEVKELTAPPDETVSFPLTVKNLTDRKIPTKDTFRNFQLLGRLFPAGTGPSAPVGPECSVDMPPKDIRGGREERVRFTLRSPARPGRYVLCINLVENGYCPVPLRPGEAMASLPLIVTTTSPAKIGTAEE